MNHKNINIEKTLVFSLFVIISINLSLVGNNYSFYIFTNYD